jgi:hypothetical protein
LVLRYHEAGFVCDPCDHFTEDPPQKSLFKLALVAQREVEVLRKPIGLEEALLQTGASLEDPRIDKLGMRIDSGEQPAENVVLLHDIWQQAECGRCFENFTLVDHATPCFQRSGTHSRHAVCKWLDLRAGSRCA